MPKSAKPKVSITDVARAAGVSTATVDRVLNLRGGVRPDKEERIIETARALVLDRALSHRGPRQRSDDAIGLGAQQGLQGLDGPNGARVHGEVEQGEIEAEWQQIRT